MIMMTVIVILITTYQNEKRYTYKASEAVKKEYSAKATRVKYATTQKK